MTSQQDVLLFSVPFLLRYLHLSLAQRKNHLSLYAVAQPFLLFLVSANKCVFFHDVLLGRQVATSTNLMSTGDMDETRRAREPILYTPAHAKATLLAVAN